MNKNEEKMLSLQKLNRSVQLDVGISELNSKDSFEEEATVYKPHALESLSLKVEACLKKQKELNFLAREVSTVLKKLK